MSKRNLTNSDFGTAASRLKCEGAAIKAVAKVESRGAGFDDEGFPTILFERHKFYKNANRLHRDQWHKDSPSICNPSVTPKGGYGTKHDQRVKFSQAFKLDPDAAMMACSWGTFQELGENYDDYGFHSVGEFVDMMKSGAAGHLEIFIRSIIRRGLTDELRRHDWRGFARNYNGANYEKFNYHNQMAAAYLEYRKESFEPIAAITPKPENISEHIDSLSSGSTQSAVATAIQSANKPDETRGDDANTETATEPGNTAPIVSRDSPQNNELEFTEGTRPAEEAQTSTTSETILQKVQKVGDKIQTTTEKVTSIQNSFSPISKASWFMTLTVKLGGWVLLVKAFAADNWLELLIAFGLIALAVFVYNQAKNRATAKTINK